MACVGRWPRFSSVRRLNPWLSWPHLCHDWFACLYTTKMGHKRTQKCSSGSPLYQTFYPTPIHNSSHTSSWRSGSITPASISPFCACFSKDSRTHNHQIAAASLNLGRLYCIPWWKHPIPTTNQYLFIHLSLYMWGQEIQLLPSSSLARRLNRATSIFIPWFLNLFILPIGDMSIVIVGLRNVLHLTG